MNPKEETIYSVFDLDTEKKKWEYMKAVEWCDKKGKKFRTTQNAIKRINKSKFSPDIKNALIFLMGLRCGIHVGIKRAINQRDAVRIIEEKNQLMRG